MRCKFRAGDQKRFLNSVKDKLGFSWENIASDFGLSGRTLRDWRNETLLGQKEVLIGLSKKAKIPMPPVVEEKEEWWSAKAWSAKANAIRMKMYGPPGTPEGRSKGGKISQLKRILNPELYRGTGVIVRNSFNYPPESSRLAEFIGIMLGDGGISKDQVKISLDMNADKKYVPIVMELIQELFGKKPSLYNRKKFNVSTICLTGVNLVSYLINKGLCVGSKLRANIGLPDWIVENLDYSKACIRGLIDTDGCFFKHGYKVKGKFYEYKKISFVSYIPQLIADVKKQLLLLGFHPKIQGGKRLFLYNQHEALRYLREIGTSNPKNYFRWRLSER